MNKAVYLGLSIELSKIVMYQFWYDYVKPIQYEEKASLLYGHRQFHCLHKNR